MNPFRRSADEALPELRPTEAVRDAVSQMVRQFADPYALGRELVQNSIDAGAKRIDVRLHFDEEDGVARLVVSDDGAGMTLEIIERCLLTLFRSSKEGDRSKIGKFGVGFFSIFALEPTEVLVDTGTSPDAVGHRVVLRPDFSFDIEETTGRVGTLVTLKLTATKAQAKEHAQRLLEALVRWCPYVEVPIHAVSAVPGATYDQRIDRPFGAPSDVAITRKDTDGSVYSLGIAPPTEGPITGYYRRGILLHAANTPLVPHVVARIDSPSLGHTLSRDDVRRDQHFERVVSFAKSLVESDLRSVASEALQRSVEACSAARAKGTIAEKDAKRWFELAAFLQSVGRPLCFPLTNPIEGKSYSSPSSVPEFCSDAASALTDALARATVPVVDLGAFGTGETERLARVLHSVAGKDVPKVGARYGLPRVLREDRLTTEEGMLLNAVRELAPFVGLSTVRMADPYGLGSDRFYFALDAQKLERLNESFLLQASELDESLFTIFSTRGLALCRLHPRVRAAASLAAKDPSLGASMLLRMVLLEAGKLDAKRDAAIVQWLAGMAS